MVVVVDFEVVLAAEAESAGAVSVATMTRAASVPLKRAKRCEFGVTGLNVTPVFQGESEGR
jgi:predicted secreted protein